MDQQGRSPTIGQCNRDFPRRSVILRGRFRVNTFEFHCNLLNLSLSGAKVKLDLPLEKGTPVEMEIRECEPMPAEVVWVQDGQMGLKFLIGAEDVRQNIGTLGESLLNE